MGCSCPLLYDQHWQTSEVFDFFRSADEMAVSTFKPVSKVDIDFRANIRGPGTHRQTIVDSNKCDMEIKTPEKIKAHNVSFRALIIGNRSARKQIINL